MKINKLTNVYFDLDGTLLDTAPDLAYALNQVILEEHSHCCLEYKQIRMAASQGCKGLLGLAFNIDERHPDYLRLKTHFLDEYSKHLCTNTILFSGMDKVLKNLDDLGIPWGVVTSKSTSFTRGILDKLNLLARCACIVGADCTEKQKPDAEPLLLACKLTNSNPKQCVYIGDSRKDVQAAKNAEMRSIAALYGYIEQEDEPETWNADYYIDHPQDILVWLEKQLTCYISDGVKS